MCGWKGATIADGRFRPDAGAGQIAELAAGVRAGGLLHARPGRWRRLDRVRYDALLGPSRLPLTLAW
jgi:hypothetical protein